MNREAAARSGEELGFSFGANWRKYLQALTPERVDAAATSLKVSCGISSFEGLRFIDLGSGSGLFSLCAFRLGAAEVVSVDIDPDSVACAVAVRASAGSPEGWAVRAGSVLDRSFLDTIEPGDVVYSWGVLHHTGAMWEAVENAMTLVVPGGRLCLALYNRPRHLPFHMALKRTYNRLPRLLRPVLALAYANALAVMLTLSRRNPLAYVRGYPDRNRGMSFWRDVEDWLGGLPFEFADEAQVHALAEAKRFAVERVIVRNPGANNEYLLRRLS